MVPPKGVEPSMAGFVGLPASIAGGIMGKLCTFQTGSSVFLLFGELYT